MSKIPNGLTVIYFNDKDKNIYAELPPDNEQAKKLSKLVYREAMTAISTENKTNSRKINLRLFVCRKAGNLTAAIPLGRIIPYCSL